MRVKDTIIDTSIGLAIPAFISVPGFMGRLDVSVTLVLLLGVWALDILLKRMLKLDNETAFADLSFATSAFVCGKIVEVIIRDNQIDNPMMGKLLIIAFTTIMLWLVNLSICRGIISKANKANKKTNIISPKVSFIISCFLGFTSLCSILLPQVLRWV